MHMNFSGVQSSLLISFMLFFPFVVNPIGYNVFGLPKFLFLQLLVLFSIYAISTNLLLDSKNKIDLRFRNSPILFPLLTFLAIVSLATINSIDIYTSIFGDFGRFEGLYTYFLYVMVAALAAHSITNERTSKKLLNVSLISLLFISIYTAAQHFGYDYTNRLYKGHPFATIGNANTLGTYLSVGIILCVTSLLLSKNKYALIAKSVIFFSALLALIFSLTRAAWLSTALSIFFLFILSKRFVINLNIGKISRLKLYSILLAILSVVLFVWFSFNLPGKQYWSKEKLNKRITSVYSQTDNSSKYRLILWKHSLSIIADNPLLGTGPETFKYSITNYNLTNQQNTKKPDRAHNDYLNVACNTGLLGLASFLWILFFAFLKTVQFATFKLRSKRTATNIEGEEADNQTLIVLGVSCSIFAYLITMFFGISHITITPFLWLLLGTLIGCTNFSKEKGPCQEKQQETKYITDIPERNYKAIFIRVSCIVITVFLASALIYRPLLADIYVNRALNDAQSALMNGKIKYDESFSNFETAVNLAPKETHYNILYAKNLLDAYTLYEDKYYLHKLETILADDQNFQKFEPRLKNFREQAKQLSALDK